LNNEWDLVRFLETMALKEKKEFEPGKLILTLISISKFN